MDKTNNYIDINVVDKLDDRVNFIIKCDDQVQLEKLMNLLEVKKRNVTYEDVINKLIKDS